MKKWLKAYLLIPFIVILLCGCNRTRKPFISQLRKCTIFTNDTTLENRIFPFNESEYLTSEMRKYFKVGVNIDSTFSTLHDGDSILYFKYYDENSQLIFSLNNYNEGKYIYKIALFQIYSNFIKLRNNFEFGMSRKDIFDALKLDKVNCDTVQILNKSSGYYYMFVFKNNKLNYLSKEYFH